MGQEIALAGQELLLVGSKRTLKGPEIPLEDRYRNRSQRLIKVKKLVHGPKRVRVTREDNLE